MTGREGCTGVTTYLGGKISFARQTVKIGGPALSMTTKDFEELLATVPAFRRRVGLYAQAFVYQVQITAACNSMHSVEQRLARWLTSMHDRSGADEFPLTQDSLAEILGVHRPTISTAVKSLQNAGLIDSHRGRIRIVDAARLRSSCCECYGLMQMADEVLLFDKPEP